MRYLLLIVLAVISITGCDGRQPLAEADIPAVLSQSGHECYWDNVTRWEHRYDEVRQQWVSTGYGISPYPRPNNQERIIIGASISETGEVLTVNCATPGDVAEFYRVYGLTP